MKRRSFLQMLGAGAVWAGMCSRGRAAEPLAGRHWAWTAVAAEADDETLEKHFSEIRAAGIDSILLRIDERAAGFARSQGLSVHSWTWTLCRGDRELMEDHPDWYVVNRLGESACDKPAYVGYYHFLCPSRPEVRAWLAARIGELARLDWLDGVHLDYIRYPDVILPVALWERYGLVQNEELPEFDYCYCDVCREAFAAQTGRDPLEMDSPPDDEQWRRFRWNSVTRLVNELVEVVHERKKMITAAVFPTPDIARRLVRQDWPNWNLDAVLPMIYQHFYEKDIAWIEQAVAEGIAALPADRPLYAGLYMPSLQDESEFREAVDRAMVAGAAGVSLFGGVQPLVKP